MENNQNNGGQGHGNFVATRVARPRDVDVNQGVETFFDRRFAQIRAQHGDGGAGVFPAGAGLGAGGAGVFPAGAGLGAGGAGVFPAGAGLGAGAGVVPAGAGLGAGGAGGVHAPLNNDRPTTPPQQPTRLTTNHQINTPPPRQVVIPQTQVVVHQTAPNQAHLVNGINTPPPSPRGI